MVEFEFLNKMYIYGLSTKENIVLIEILLNEEAKYETQERPQSITTPRSF